MNDADKSGIRKIRKRIEIKQTHLHNLVPDINFLRFIDELEQFQQIIEGVDSDGPTPQVQLPLARARFESLQSSHRQLIETFDDKIQRLDRYPSDLLLREFFEAIHDAKLFFFVSFRNFCSQILTSTNGIYNIRGILKVYDLLYELRVDVIIVKKNFYNLRKSTRRRQIKEVSREIYSKAKDLIDSKFQNVARLFPKLSRLPVHQLRFKVYRSKMSENVDAVDVEGEAGNAPPGDDGKDDAAAPVDNTPHEEEVAPIPEIIIDSPADEQGGGAENIEADGAIAPTEETAHVDETESDGKMIELHDVKAEHKENLAEEISPEVNKESIEEQPEEQIREEPAEPAVASPEAETKEPESIEGEQSSELGRRATPSIDQLLTDSLTKISYNIKTELEARKAEMVETLHQIDERRAQLQDITKQIEMQANNFKAEIREIEKRKKNIVDDLEMSEDDKMKFIQDITLQLGQLTGVNDERIKKLEAERTDFKNQSLEQAQKFNDIRLELNERKLIKFERLEAAEMEAAEEEEKEKIQKTVETLKQIYEEELKELADIDETIESFEVDDNGVYYMDSSNNKRYLTSIGRQVIRPSKEIGAAAVSRSCTISTASGETKAATTSLETTDSSSATEEEEPLPLDSENYIKATLGKPLRQALAAITVYQPSDPINYLANYLLQYRYNELRNIQRQQDFENLVAQRERYIQQVQLENMIHERQLNACDPCFTPQPDRL